MRERKVKQTKLLCAYFRCTLLLVPYQNQCMKKCSSGWWWESTSLWRQSRLASTSLECWILLALRSLKWVLNVYLNTQVTPKYLYFFHVKLLLQLCYYKFMYSSTPLSNSASTLPMRNCNSFSTTTCLCWNKRSTGTRGVQERRDWMGVHWLRHGFTGLHRSHWESESQ